MELQQITKTNQGNHQRETQLFAKPALPLRAQVHPLLQLRETMGNMAMQYLLRSGVIQAKLKVNQPGDIYEQEADRVAEQVMRMPEPQLQRACACDGGCPKCQKEHERLQTKHAGASDSGQTTAPPIVHEVLRSPGQPLDTAARALMEPRFGHNFSQVRVHTDDQAVNSAQAISARAYTVGRNIAFGQGQYSPQTLEGRRLLAHELTHVVHQTGASESVPTLQRKDEGEAKPAPTFPSSVTFTGCDQGPFRLDYVRQSAENAFDQTRDGDCIKNESLKRDILAGYKGLTIVCSPDVVAGSCAKTDKTERKIELFKYSTDSSRCPAELAATIFHESIHVAEGFNLFHGDLAWDCGESCYPGSDKLKRGDASKCDYERGWRPFAGISAGGVIPGKGPSTGYVRVYAGLEKRGPILSIFRPSLGIGLSIIGDTTTGEPDDISSGTSKLLSIIGALRFDPGKEGGAYFSLTGGPEIALSSERSHLGYEVGTRLGYRWYIYDFSLNAGIEYDPTRNAGEERMYTLGATFQIAPKVRR